MPAGVVLPWMGNTIPEGFLLCDGAAISRTVYSKLFAAIGTTYGAGDGSTTFNLPKLTDGRFLEGSTAAGVYKAAGLPNITGKVDGHLDLLTSDGAFYLYNPEGAPVASEPIGNHTFAFDASRSNAIYGNSTTVQPNALTTKYIIKY